MRNLLLVPHRPAEHLVIPGQNDHKDAQFPDDLEEGAFPGIGHGLALAGAIDHRQAAGNGLQHKGIRSFPGGAQFT